MIHDSAWLPLTGRWTMDGACTRRSWLCALVSLSGISVFASSAGADSLAGVRNVAFTWPCRIVPEYRRTLSRVVLSVPADNGSLELQKPILDNLPAYSAITMLIPRGVEEDMQYKLRNAGYRERIKFVTYDPEFVFDGSLMLLNNGRGFNENPVRERLPVQLGTRWAQDLFVPVVDPNASLKVVTPPFYMGFWRNRSGSNGLRSDNSFLEAIEGAGIADASIPVAFTGGNIRFGETGGRTIAFCGSDILLNTAALYSLSPELAVEEHVVAEILARVFGVDRVVVIGAGDRQPSLMYHLDQAFLLLEGGVACVTRVTGDRDKFKRYARDIAAVEAYLEKVREELVAAGFAILHIDTSVHNVLRSEYYVNAIPYIDRETGEKRLLMPVFEAIIRSDTEVLAENIKRIQTLDYEVVPVPTRAGRLKGGIHCLVNVLE